MHWGDPRAKLGGAEPGGGGGVSRHPAAPLGPWLFWGGKSSMAQPGPPPGGPQPQAVGFGSVLPWDPTRGGLEGPHGVRGSVGWGVPRHQPRDWGRWRPGGVSHGGGVSCRRQGPLGYGGIWGPHWGGGLWEGTSGTCGGPLGDLWGSRGNRGWGPHRGRGCPHGVLVPHRVPRGVPTGGSGAPRGGPMCPWVTPFGGGGGAEAL